MEILKYQKIILDTGPLFLLLVGWYNPQKLDKISFTEEQFGILLSYIHQFNESVVTPHVLAEMSNLAGNRLKENFPEFMEKTAVFLQEVEEEHIKKEEIIAKNNRKLLVDFGITDAALALASGKDRLILTADHSFFQYCYNKGIPALHLEAVFNKAV